MVQAALSPELSLRYVLFDDQGPNCGYNNIISCSKISTRREYSLSVPTANSDIGVEIVSPIYRYSQDRLDKFDKSERRRL